MVARIAVIAVAAFLTGTALATVPFNENEYCSDNVGREGDSIGGGTTVWPLRTHCTIRSGCGTPAESSAGAGL